MLPPFDGATLNALPEQMVSKVLEINGVGLTSMVKVWLTPVHVKPETVYEGVTTIFEVTVALVEFVAGKDVILPEPDAPMPIEGLLFVQL